MARWDLFSFETWGTSQSATLYSFLWHIVTSVIRSSNSVTHILSAKLSVAGITFPMPFLLWKDLFWEGHSKLSCWASIIHHLWELNRRKVTRHFIKSGHLCWQYNNRIQISLGHMISRAWAFTLRISPHLLPAPQITCWLSRSRREGQRASPHACHSQQCPILKPSTARVVRPRLREWEKTTHSG